MIFFPNFLGECSLRMGIGVEYGQLRLGIILQQSPGQVVPLHNGLVQSPLKVPNPHSKLII